MTNKVDVINTDLEKLTVLFLDIQTTGANPAKGAIIEIGWAQSGHNSKQTEYFRTLETCFVKTSDNQDIPERVKAVTGICQDDIASGVAARDVWYKLVHVAEGIAYINKMNQCPTIIHYARFESFLIKISSLLV